MKIVFLMAGEGRRFLGYQDTPKPLIKLAGIELIRWAVNSYNFIGYGINWSDIFFISRQDHKEKYAIDKILHRFFSSGINIRYVEKTTRGPAETAFLLADEIRKDEQVIISDCDMFFNSLPLYAETIRIKDDESIRGILPYIERQDNQNSWSYVQLDKDKRVIKVDEKNTEMFNSGCPGIIGAYTFNRWKFFVEEAEKMIKEGDMAGEEIKKEFYLSRIYQRMVNAGQAIKGVNVAPSWVLGTPAQFTQFEDFIKKAK